MANALVLMPMQRLRMDGERSLQTRGSFLVDSPPVSPINQDDLFRTSDCTQDIKPSSRWPSRALISPPPTRKSSLASGTTTSNSTSRMFLSLSASTRNFLGHSDVVIPENEKVVFEAKAQKIHVELPSLESAIAQSTVRLISPGADELPHTDWLTMAEGTTILDAATFSDECNLFNDQPNRLDGSLKPLFEHHSDTNAPTSDCESPEVQNSDSQSIAPPLSFVSGSLRYSKQSLLTVKPNSPGILDDATIGRIRKRRDLIEELLQTEEIYISEMRTLLNVYFGSVNDDVYPFTERKAMFIRSIGGVLELHERLYQAMQHAIPRSFESRQAPWDLEAQITSLPSPFNTANPAAAALLANAFDETMKDLLAYEDFISKYDSMLKDGNVFKSNAHRRSWERDCELLSNSFLSKSNKTEQGKRAMTFEDLLMKPIQRICKYPLFFTELLRVTPVIDCPESNAILERVNHRVKETIYQLDMAKDNSPKVRERLERTWLLQKRLSFKDKLGPLPRLLGQIILCGPLYAVWKDSKGVRGEYLACLLYKSYLLLATVSKSDSSLNIVLAISLVTARIEEASQGAGIQCHNAPFSWTLVFENDFRLYEVILCAWNAREEEVWRESIADRISTESENWEADGSPTQRTLFVRPIACNIESSGSTRGYHGSLKRHWSFHGSVAIPQKTDPLAVSIQNTWAPSELALQPRVRPTKGLSRSTSVVSMSSVFTLSPKRSSRTRVESALNDVWSKDKLPAGTSSWLGPRKFSMGSIPTMASLTSSFSRRTSNVFSDNSSSATTTASSSSSSTSSPTRAQEKEGSETGSPVEQGRPKYKKRRSGSLGPVERIRCATSGKFSPTATPASEAERDGGSRSLSSSSSRESPTKEPKTPTTPVWQSWGSFMAGNTKESSKDSNQSLASSTTTTTSTSTKRDIFSNSNGSNNGKETSGTLTGAPVTPSKGHRNRASMPPPSSEKVVWKRKRWSSPGGVMRFFECDAMFNSGSGGGSGGGISSSGGSEKEKRVDM